jgi:candicidin polyketide synthase FscB
VRKRLESWPGRLSVAAVNGPTATVVSGELGALAALAQACAAAGVRTKAVAVDYPSHSPQVEALREEILAALAPVTPGPARIPMISAMTGEFLDGPEADAEYWYASLRAPVEFSRAVQVLAGAGYRTFIEVSPHPVLATAVTETLEDAGQASTSVVISTLRRNDGGFDRFLSSLGEAHITGVPVDWAKVLPAGQRVTLPTYAFQRQRYWPRPSRPLLGAPVELADGEGHVFTGRLSRGSHPWLADHAVTGTVLLPGTAFVELLLRAGSDVGCGRISELTLRAPLVLPADATIQVQLTVGTPDQAGQRAVALYSRAEDLSATAKWTRHADGLLGPEPDGPAGSGWTADFAAWPPEGAVPVAVDDLYPRLAAAGYEYGPVFQGLRAVWRRGGDIFAEAVLGDDAAADARSFLLHPALLDAVLHAGLSDVGEPPADIQLPFAWTGVSLRATGASALRARISHTADGALCLAAVDGTGSPVLRVDSVATRPIAARQLTEVAVDPRESLFAEVWVPVTVPAAAYGRWAIAGHDPLGLADRLGAAGAEVSEYRSMSALASSLEAEAPVPGLVLAYAGMDGSGGTDGAGGSGADGDGPHHGGTASAAREAVAAALLLVQEWLAADRLAESRLVVVTRGAVGAGPDKGVADLAGAAVWGLVRSAQSEHPGRIVLADLPAASLPADETEPDPVIALAAALESQEPELAIRSETAYGRRLARPDGGLLTPPHTGGPWRLDIAESGKLDGLALVECPQAAAPLEDGQVRVAVRAAGMNFRDLALSLGLIGLEEARIGGDVAGVVLETGAGVTGLTRGDRVLGMADGAFGPMVVTDARLLAPIPEGWSFAQAAAIPVAFMTVWYGLVDLAGAQAGQRLLVHAASGAVGMAATAIARHLGLDVYGTASPGKWPVLTGLGLDQAHIASSRTAEFEEKFLSATGGAGMDIVLNALAGDLTDASLRLLPNGGRFLEMGKTDIRDPAAISRQYPGVAYRAFDLREAGPDRLGQILAQVVELLATGDLPPLPVTAWDVRRGQEAFRYMSQARHTGKIVLTIPPDPAVPRNGGAVLITGGTGTLGALVARHLAARRSGALVLASRSGPAAPGAARLAADLAAQGAGVRVTACDAADRGALSGLLATVAAEDQLKGVVHAAGVLNDGLIGSLTPTQVDAVMRPKADAAWHLHELTESMDLESFVLFSSASATFGSAGQGNYGAANAFLDGLASHRRSRGLPAISLAWGLWADASAMTGHLGETGLARMARDGLAPLTAEQGLALLDLATARDDVKLVPAGLDVARLRARAAGATAGEVPVLFSELTGRPAVERAAAFALSGSDVPQTLRERLEKLPEPDRDRLLLDLVRGHAAAVLGHLAPDALQPARAFRDLGFDSLTALELRNRLNAATGLSLPATLVFSYPTPAALAEHLLAESLGEEASYRSVLTELGKLESALSAISEDSDKRLKIRARLEAIARGFRAADAADAQAGHELDDASDEEMFELINNELGIA